jgi:hypothetical protein
MTKSKSGVISLLSLSLRERIEVRDYSGHAFQALTKWPEERYRVLRALDDSRNELRQFLGWSEIPLVPGRVFRGGGSHGLNHPIRWQASRPDNKNPGRTGRLGAAAGICSLRSFDFEDVAREFAHNRWRSYGDNGRESLGDCLTTAIFYEKRNCPPHLNPLPASRGEAGSSISKDVDVCGQTKTKS